MQIVHHNAMSILCFVASTGHRSVSIIASHATSIQHRHPAGTDIKFAWLNSLLLAGLSICGNITTYDKSAAVCVLCHIRSIFTSVNGDRVYKLMHPDISNIDTMTTVFFISVYLFTIQNVNKNVI